MGQYGQWPSFPTQDLRRSMVLQAQFSAPASTLADQEGVAQVLVEGTFAPDAVLTVQAETPPAQKIDGYTPRSAWSYTVTGSQTDTLTIRLRADGIPAPGSRSVRKRNLDPGREHTGRQLSGLFRSRPRPHPADGKNFVGCVDCYFRNRCSCGIMLNRPDDPAEASAGFRNLKIR